MFYNILQYEEDTTVQIQYVRTDSLGTKRIQCYQKLFPLRFWRFSPSI
jgi:hypothetical protein